MYKFVAKGQEKIKDRINLEEDLKKFVEDPNLDTYLKMTVADDDSIRYVSELISNKYPTLGEYFKNSNIEISSSGFFYKYRLVNHNAGLNSSIVFRVFMKLYYQKQMLCEDCLIWIESLPDFKRYIYNEKI